MTKNFDDHRFGFWRCDECGRTLSAYVTQPHVIPQVPQPWRSVIVHGYLGDFHCCGDTCELDLRLRLATEAGP